MNKNEMRERIKRLEYDLATERAHNADIEDRLKALNSHLTREHEHRMTYVKWYNDAAERKHFLERCLTKLLSVIALDIVNDGTHRSRNEYWKSWFTTIQTWQNSTIATDMDEIPF